MKNPKSLYHGHRFPAAVISCAVRWYFRFQLSLRDIEELLFERTWHLDEVFVTLRGEPYLLWRAVDQHGAELDILLRASLYRKQLGERFAAWHRFTELTHDPSAF